MSTKPAATKLGALLEHHFVNIKTRFKRAAPAGAVPIDHNVRLQLAAVAAEDRKMSDHRGVSDGDCLKEFAAAYEKLKARFEDELAKLKHDIKLIHKNVRTEVLTGDPQKGAELAHVAIEWMSGVNVIFQETKQRPDLESVDHRAFKC